MNKRYWVLCIAIFISVSDIKPENKVTQAIETKELPKSIGHSYTLSQQTSNPKRIFGWMRLLSEMVGQRLRKLGLEAYTISIWVNSSQNRGFSKQKTFQTSVYLGIDIFMRSKAILDLKKGQKTSLRALGISVSGLKPHTQIPLLKKEKTERSLAQITDKINDKYGDWTIYPAVLTSIHRDLNS